MRITVDVYCASYARRAAAVTLEIDDTCDVLHGRRLLSLSKAHYGGRCFLPINIYDTTRSRPVALPPLWRDDLDALIQIVAPYAMPAPYTAQRLDQLIDWFKTDIPGRCPPSPRRALHG